MGSKTDILGREVHLVQFQEIFADFLAGRVNLAQLRQSLAQALEEDLACASEVQDILDVALKEGSLPEQTWEILAAEVDHAISEDAPTDWSEDLAGLAEEAGADAPPEMNGPPVLTERVATPARPRSSAASRVTDPGQPLAPGTLLRDRFVIVSRAESGSMGHVYKALDRRRKEAGAADPWVAIKVLSPEFSAHPDSLRALQNEAANGQKLTHPHVVRVYDFDRDDGLFFISMEWLDGESLAALLDRTGQKALPAEQAMQILQAVAQGLAHAHSRNVIHADVKPGNVFLTRNGHIKLLDFGIARAADDADASKGSVARTPAYASCEVLEGEAPTAADDLYALAVLACRMLTGHRPFGAATALEAESRGLRPAAVAVLREDQQQALAGALAFRRSNRCSSVEAFMQALFAPAPQPAEVVTAAPEPPPPVPETASVKAAEVQTAPLDDADAGEPFLLPVATPRPAWQRPAIAAGIAALAIAALMLFSDDDKAPAPVPVVRLPDPPSAEAAADAPPMLASHEQASLADEQAAVVEPAESLPSDAADAETTATVAQTSGIQAASPIRQADPKPKPEPEVTVPDREPSVAINDAGKASALPAAGVTSGAPQGKGTDPVTQTTKPAAAAVAASTPVVKAPAVDEKPLERVTRSEPTVSASAAAKSPAADEVAEAVTQAAEASAESRPAADTAAAQQAEPLLASTMAMAMVSPESASPAGEVSQDSASEPRQMPARSPGDYGPQPAPGRPRVEQVPLSTLEFDRYVEPRFPRRTGRRQISGWVDVEFRVNTAGETEDIRILGAKPEGFFEDAATDAVTAWRFKPRITDGTPVESISGVRLRFEP